MTKNKCVDQMLSNVLKEDIARVDATLDVSIFASPSIFFSLRKIERKKRREKKIVYTIFCQNPLSTNRKIFKYKSLYRAILGVTFKSHVRPKGQPTCQSEQRRFY